MKGKVTITKDDERLILACKKERDKLKIYLHQLSNKMLGIKFGVSESTIKRI